jgi:hypothetical protein
MSNLSRRIAGAGSGGDGTFSKRSQVSTSRAGQPCPVSSGSQQRLQGDVALGWVASSPRSSLSLAISLGIYHGSQIEGAGGGEETHQVEG